MGTSASINIQNKDGEYFQTLVNWDGYLSYVGKVLYENYTTIEEVSNLINGGEIRSFDILENGNVDVEYYNDNDYYPILTKDYDVDYFNYIFGEETGKWIVTFYDCDNDQDVTMDLGEALIRYPLL